MSETRSRNAEMLGTGMGILAFLFVGVAMVLAPTGAPGVFDSGAQAQPFVQNHQAGLWAAVVLMSQGLLPLAWFAFYVPRQLSEAAAGTRSSGVAFYGGVIGLLGFFGGTLLLAVATYRAGGADVASVEALWDRSMWAYLVGSLGFGLMAAVIGAMRLRLGKYSGWFLSCTASAMISLYVGIWCVQLGIS